MTPTYFGRVQTRFILTIYVGLTVAELFAIIFGSFAPIIAVGLMFILGLLWDGIYTKLQLMRWNADWPPVFSIAGGIAEAVALWFVTGLVGGIKLPYFILIYGVIWLCMFVAQLSLYGVFFPYSRFNGGEVL